MSVLCKILKVVAEFAGMAMLGLLFTGPYIKTTPYYIALSVCAACIAAYLFFTIEIGDRNNG